MRVHKLHPLTFRGYYPDCTHQFSQETCIIITDDEFSNITAASHLNPLLCHRVTRNASAVFMPPGCTVSNRDRAVRHRLMLQLGLSYGPHKLLSDAWFKKSTFKSTAVSHPFSLNIKRINTTKEQRRTSP